MRFLKTKPKSSIKEVWPVHVVYDDREKKPWTIRHLKFQFEKGHLVTGDYAISGTEGKLVIEKKSGLKELIGNITGKKRKIRFEQFLQRLSAVPHCCIIVEGRLGNINEVFAGLKYSGQGPKNVYYWLARIMLEYHIPILFFDGKGYEKQSFLYELFSVANTIVRSK